MDISLVRPVCDRRYDGDERGGGSALTGVGEEFDAWALIYNVALESPILNRYRMVRYWQECSVTLMLASICTSAICRMTML